MLVESLCRPALIYLIYSLIQIVIDTLNGFYNAAFIKLWISLLFTSLLHILCDKGLGIISWTIVFLPFLFTALLTSILLLEFGLDPTTGVIHKKEKPVVTKTQNNVITSDKPYIVNSDGLTHYHSHYHNNILHNDEHTHPNLYNTLH